MKALCLILGFSLAAQASDASLLLRATEHARAGRLRDAGELAELRALVASDRALPDRVTAAYLLTLSETEPRNYINFVYEHPAELASLGREAQARILWQHAEEKYEQGAFEQAAADYDAARAIAPPATADYATLKLGWCSLNRQRPPEAFTIWADALQARPSEAPAYLAFWQGLGETLVESRAPREQWRRLARLHPRAEEIEALAAGIVEAKALAPVQNGAPDLPYRAELTEAVLSKALSAGRPACDFAPWLSVALTSSALPLIEDCLASGAPSHREELAEALARLDLRGGTRELRLRFFELVQDQRARCEEGLRWLSDEGPVAPAPAAPIAEACTRAKAVRPVIEALDKADRTHWLSPSDPYVFLSARLARRPEFRQALREALESRPDFFRGTILPRLVAERAAQEGEGQIAFSLWRQFAKADGALSWNDIALRNLSRLLEKGDREGARRFLDDTFPITPARPAAELAARAWYLYLTTPETSAPEALSWLLSAENRARHAALAPKLAEVACAQSVFEPFAALASLAPGCLFAALVDGKTSVPANGETELATQAELVRAFDPEKLASAPLVGNQAWTKDLRFLQGLEKAARAAKTPKDPVRAIQASIASLQRNTRQIAARTWSQPRLLSLSRQWLAHYCADARRRLQNWQSVSDEPAWASTLAQVAARFARCEEGKTR